MMIIIISMKGTGDLWAKGICEFQLIDIIDDYRNWSIELLIYLVVVSCGRALFSHYFVYYRKLLAITPMYRGLVLYAHIAKRREKSQKTSGTLSIELLIYLVVY